VGLLWTGSQPSGVGVAPRVFPDAFAA
jgi:hypothetical protein